MKTTRRTSALPAALRAALMLLASALPAQGLEEWVGREEIDQAIPEFGSAEGSRLVASVPPPPPRVRRMTVSAVLASEIALGQLDKQFGAGAFTAVGLAFSRRLRPTEPVGLDIELTVGQATSSAGRVNLSFGKTQTDRAENLRFNYLMLGPRWTWQQRGRFRPFVGGAATYRQGKVDTEQLEIKITGYGVRAAAGVDFKTGKTDQFILTAQLAYDLWLGSSSGGGSGLESSLGLAIFLGARF